MRYDHNFFTGILREGVFINVPYNMSPLYTKDASSVSTHLVDGLATVTMTSRFSIETGLLCCRKYKLTATSTIVSLISQQASAA
jgi:hypothetical protein